MSGFSSLSAPTLLHAALDYAARGWPVFPLHGIHLGRCTCGRRDCSSPGKHPLTRKGLHDATADEGVIRRWWRQWRLANVAIATGVASGIVIVDVDLPDALSSIDEVVDDLPRTLTGLTGGGGVHFVYACDRPLGNTTGRLPGYAGDLPGIDLRADGGYIVAPPSVHRSRENYCWLDARVQPVPLPEWIQEVRPPVAAAAAVRPATFEGTGTAYGRAALDGALTSLRRAPVGQRNSTLNRVTFALAQLVAGGELLEATALAALKSEARRRGLGERETKRTIESAFRAGRLRPRHAPSRATTPTAGWRREGIG